jgi:hypothetical protein
MFFSPGALVAILLAVHHAFALRVPFQRVRRTPALERRSGISKVSVLATNDDDGLELRCLIHCGPGPDINRITAPCKTCCIWLMHVYLYSYHSPS